jgi:hypothetical protein
MPVPVLVLLLFALWTLLTLMFSLAPYRVGHIVSRQASIDDYRFPDVDQSERHRQALRAHVNCLENLAVYGALVLVMVYTGTFSPVLSVLAGVLFGFRVFHTLVHVGLPQRGKVLILRFSLFLVQFICLAWMGVYLLIV